MDLKAYRAKSSPKKNSPPKLPEHHLGAVDYGSFRPVESLLSAEGVLPSVAERNQAAQLLLNESSSHVLEALKRKIEALGVFRLSSNVKHGAYALVFEAPNHQVVRIGLIHAGDPPRSKDPDVLQPLISRKTKEFRIEVLPKVHTLEEVLDSPILSRVYHLGHDPQEAAIKAEAMVRDMVLHNLNKVPPKLFFDISRGNIGVLLDKKQQPVFVIIDPGAVCDLEKAGNIEHLQLAIRYSMQDHYLGLKDECQKHMKAGFYMPRYNASGVGIMVAGTHQEMQEACKRHVAALFKEAYTDKRIDYVSAQRGLRRSLGLSQDSVAGVSTLRKIEEVLEEFAQERSTLKTTEHDPNHSIWAQSLRAGVGKSEFGSMATAAANEHFNESEHYSNDPEKGLAENPADHRPGFCHRIKEEAKKRGVEIK